MAFCDESRRGLIVRWTTPDRTDLHPDICIPYSIP
jgi:hypothetical protein